MRSVHTTDEAARTDAGTRGRQGDPAGRQAAASNVRKSHSKLLCHLSSVADGATACTVI